jgi:2-polyprenyl-3-methyl-5-hydroxy-6-metoxy-1,4-benzoquinol methylase
MMMDDSEDKQRAHYESISGEYNKHHGHYYSKLYRQRFIYETLLGKGDLKEKVVLDAMCGGGQTGEYLKSESANVIAIDISTSQVDNYRDLS